MKSNSWDKIIRPFKQNRIFSDDFNNLLVNKGNELNVVIIGVVMFFGLIFTIINIFYDYYHYAILSMMLIPIAFLSYFLFKKVSATASKLFNLFGAVAVISLQHLLQTEDSFVIIFFIPILISTLF